MRFTRTLCLTTIIATAFPVAALADHTNPFNVPKAPAPVVAVPTAVAAPPPVIAAPPPVVAPPPLVNNPIMTPSIVLPTDATSVVSSVRTPPSKATARGPLPVPSVASGSAALPPGWNDPDTRFDFTDGTWIAFSENYFRDKFGQFRHEQPAESKEAASEPAPDAFPSSGFEAGVTYNDQREDKSRNQAKFLPTPTSFLSKIDDTSLKLNTGAVLIRASSEPVFVHATIAGVPAKIEFRGKAVALLSTYDNKIVVLNLTDDCCNSIHIHLSGELKDQRISVQSGQGLELYADPSQPNSNWVATSIIANKRLTSKHCLLLSQLNYVRALKRFQIRQALPKFELERVLKTAAAIASISR